MGVLDFVGRIWAISPPHSAAFEPLQHSYCVFLAWSVVGTPGRYWGYIHTSQRRSGLSPALMFTVVCFAALTHAMHTVQANPGGLWSETVYHAFTTLIAQGLPEQPPADRLELMLLYGGVLFFSVFVLNIFIGIIGEQYSSERALATHKFYAARASSCLTYLVRASVIPCDLCSSVVAGLLCHGCAFAALLAQILALAYGWKLPEPWQLLAFVFCQMTMVISAFQCRGSDS